MVFTVFTLLHPAKPAMQNWALQDAPSESQTDDDGERTKEDKKTFFVTRVVAWLIYLMLSIVATIMALVPQGRSPP